MRQDLDVAELRRKLAGRLVGAQVLHFDELASTMDEARRLAEHDAVEGTVVLAEQQTAGRGRFARPWSSERGQDVLLSLVLRPSVGQLPSVNMAATLAVCIGVAEITGLEATIKWPNDVRIGGRKVAGILMESAIEAGEPRFAVVGIGINVNLDTSRFAEIASTATSLSHETGSDVDRTAVLLGVLESLDNLYGAVRAGQKLTARWAARMDTIGRDVKVQWRSKLLEGRADCVDDQGNLILARPDGSTVTVVAGEVTLQV